jgi:hypothetical protein
VGSVPSLYTTGDNDPEIEPTQYYRHYFYCDECGAFELAPWVEPESHQRIERFRRRLGMTAACATVLWVTAGWLALGLPPMALSFVLITIFGVALYLALRSLAVFRLPGGRAEISDRWSQVWEVLPWAAGTLGAEILVLVAPWQYWVSALAGAVLVAGLLIWRAVLGERIRVVGVRCRECGATYSSGSPLLADLEANPRGLAEADVPRPLGSSYFRVGRSVEPGSPS